MTDNAGEISIEPEVQNWTLPDQFGDDPLIGSTRWTPCRPHLGNFSARDDKQRIPTDGDRLKWRATRNSQFKHLGLGLAGLFLFLPGGISFFFVPWMLAFDGVGSEPAMEISGAMEMPMEEIPKEQPPGVDDHSADLTNSTPSQTVTDSEGSSFLKALGGALLLSVLCYPVGVLFLLISAGTIYGIFNVVSSVSLDRTRGYRVSRTHQISEPQHEGLPVDRPDGSPRRGDLEEIHAVQILAEQLYEKVPDGTRSEWQNGERRTRTTYRKQRYVSYELNLVLHDGWRVNLCDHSDAKQIREDADAIAGMLDVVVWDESTRGTWWYRQSTTMQTRMNAMRGRHPLFMLVLFLGFLFSHVWKTFRGRRDRYGTWIWNSASLDADQTRSS